jgi:hypothetical protein
MYQIAYRYNKGPTPAFKLLASTYATLDDAVQSLSTMIEDDMECEEKDYEYEIIEMIPQ